MKRRTMCGTILIFLLVLILCTPVFLHVSHSHHDAHECLSCPVCIVATRLQALLMQLFVALLLLGAALPVCMIVHHAAQREKQMWMDTLVALKIRMNN